MIEINNFIDIKYIKNVITFYSCSVCEILKNIIRLSQFSLI